MTGAMLLRPPERRGLRNIEPLDRTADVELEARRRLRSVLVELKLDQNAGPGTDRSINDNRALYQLVTVGT